MVDSRLAPGKAAAWIAELKLEPHPEGGWFREVYRAAEQVSPAALPARFSGSRVFSTSIYFMLEAGQFSAFHRLKADELWHYYDGSALDLYLITAGGQLLRRELGIEVAEGRKPQAAVPTGSWVAAAPADAAGWTLFGCTVAPGFEFADFELGSRHELKRAYPQHAALIERFTRE